MMDSGFFRTALFQFLSRGLAISLFCLPPSALSSDHFWFDGEKGSSYPSGGNVSIGFSEANPDKMGTIYEKWILYYQVRVDPDKSRVVVEHRHTEKCRKNGYCFLQTDYVNVQVESTNRSSRIVSDTARVRLVREVDPENKTWVVEVIDATALPFQINPSAGSYDVNLVVVDFEQQEDYDLYDNREIATPLNKKKETRRIQVTNENGVTTTRKLPVFSDTREVFDFFVNTNVVVETMRKAVSTPIRYVKPTMKDFEEWIQSGNAVTYRERISETCPNCGQRGKWTEWRGSSQILVSCHRCNGSGVVWKERNITVKGP